MRGGQNNSADATKFYGWGGGVGGLSRIWTYRLRHAINGIEDSRSCAHMTILYNKKKQKTFRQCLRRASTEAEWALWKHIRYRQVAGYKFRRQFGVSRFVLYFYSPTLRLALEVDGTIHETPARKHHDAMRDRWLSDREILVVRFTNADVLGNIKGVLEQIHDIARAQQDTRPHPTESADAAITTRPPLM